MIEYFVHIFFAKVWLKETMSTEETQETLIQSIYAEMEQNYAQLSTWNNPGLGMSNADILRTPIRQLSEDKRPPDVVTEWRAVQLVPADEAYSPFHEAIEQGFKEATPLHLLQLHTDVLHDRPRYDRDGFILTARAWSWDRPDTGGPRFTIFPEQITLQISQGVGQRKQVSFAFEGNPMFFQEPHILLVK